MLLKGRLSYAILFLYLMKYLNLALIFR